MWGALGTHRGRGVARLVPDYVHPGAGPSTISLRSGQKIGPRVGLLCLGLHGYLYVTCSVAVVFLILD